MAAIALLLMAPAATAQTPLPPNCQELVLDGGFEADDSWQLDITSWTATVVSEGALTGQQAVLLGLGPEALNVESHSIVQQGVTFPADATRITLSLWLRPASPADDNDRHYVLFQSGQGEIVAVPFFSIVSGDDWQQQEFDISALAGQELILQIGVSNDGAGAQSSLLVDAVSIVACGAGTAESPTAEPTASATATPTSEPTAAPSPTPTSTHTLTPPPTPQPTASPTPTITDLPTPEPATATPTARAASAASPEPAATPTPTATINFVFDRPSRQLPLLDSQAAPILIATLVSSVIVLAVLAVRGRRPGS